VRRRASALTSPRFPSSSRPGKYSPSSRPSEARAGTHNHRPALVKQGGRPISSTQKPFVVMGPRFRGDDERVEHAPSSRSCRFKMSNSGASQSRQPFRKHTFAIPRRDSPGFCRSSPALVTKEGAGKAGCALHPRSRVQRDRKAHTSIQVQRRQSGLPCAMVLTVSFVLSPVTGFLATVASQGKASTSPMACAAICSFAISLPTM